MQLDFVFKLFLLSLSCYGKRVGKMVNGYCEVYHDRCYIDIHFWRIFTEKDRRDLSFSVYIKLCCGSGNAQNDYSNNNYCPEYHFCRGLFVKVGVRTWYFFILLGISVLQIAFVRTPEFICRTTNKGILYLVVCQYLA